jgi:hypothetical protein
MTKSEIVSMAYEAGCPSIIVPAEWFKFAKLVAAAAKRNWQGLTDEEVTACWKDGFDSCEQKTVADLRDFIARAIEAKLKEKNT